MIKIFELLIRDPRHSAESFMSQLSAASSHLRTAQGVRGFTVQQALRLPARADIVQLNIPANLDAFVEVWADDVASYRRALTTPAGRAWSVARGALMHSAKTLVLDEHALIEVPRPRPPTRNNAFLTRNARFTPEQFRHEWHVGHGQMCRTVPYLKGFVPCDVLELLPQTDVPEMKTDSIEGVAQAYFDSPEDELAMIRTPEAKLWFAHGAETFGLIKAFGARETVAAVPG